MFEFKRIEEVTNNLQKTIKGGRRCIYKPIGCIIAHLLETIYASY
jgi:hypothetical protein